MGFDLGKAILGGPVFGFLGGDKKDDNPYEGIALPKEVTDPLYTSSQAGLNKLGTSLTTGEGIPDYYKSIGDFNSPQFQAMLNSVKGQVMQGSQEASAIQGTGRSGTAVTASNNALNQVVPQLTYQDYLRAVQGRGGLLDLGANIQTGVRGSSQNQQQFDTNFNQQLYQDQLVQAGLSDTWQKDAAKAQGEGLANFLPVAGSIAGGIGGFLLGGPAGAMTGIGLGGQLGNAFGGSLTGNAGNSSLSQLFSSLGNMNSTPGRSGASYGISDSGLGSFKSLSSLNSNNPDVSALLNAGIG